MAIPIHRHAAKVRPVINTFGHRVRALRRGAGLKQDELAALAYVRPAFIGQIERGETNPSLVSIALVANALGCEVADFFPRKAP